MLSFFQERHERRQAPFGDVLELFYFIKEQGIVVGTWSDGRYVVTYDSNDRFNVGTRAESPESCAENLQDGDTVDIEVQGHDRDDINSFRRCWFPWSVCRSVVAMDQGLPAI